MEIALAQPDLLADVAGERLAVVTFVRDFNRDIAVV
jgi:hypothetical protein